MFIGGIHAGPSLSGPRQPPCSTSHATAQVVRKEEGRLQLAQVLAQFTDANLVAGFLRGSRKGAGVRMTGRGKGSRKGAGARMTVGCHSSPGPFPVPMLSPQPVPFPWAGSD